MRVLILNWRDFRHPKSGGAELVTFGHAREWVKRGHSVTWLTSSYANARPKETIGGVFLMRRFGSLSIYLYAPIYVLLHAKDYDVIVDEVHGIPFFSPLFTRKPIVVFIHEIADNIWDFMYPFPVNRIGKILEALYFRVYRRNLFWTDAPSTIDELVRRGIPRKQCIAIPCPIERYQLSDRNYQKENNPTYLFVSRVVRMKGIEEVIKAFSFIVKEQSRATLWVVGGGDASYIRQLKQMMEEHGVLRRSVFWGKVSNEKKIRLMARAHVLLHASVKEGWGLVVLEAASVGTPSVVYNVPGLCDAVKQNKTGIVLKDNSPHEMAREAMKLYGDKARYRHFQKNCRTWVASLKWEDIAKQSLRVLQKAMK